VSGRKGEGWKKNRDAVALSVSYGRQGKLWGLKKEGKEEETLTKRSRKEKPESFKSKAKKTARLQSSRGETTAREAKAPQGEKGVSRNVALCVFTRGGKEKGQLLFLKRDLSRA